MKRREFVLQSVALVGVALSSNVWAQAPKTQSARNEPMRIGAAIDRSGRQRMLSQRMAKAQLQILNATQVDRSRRVLSESIRSFDESLTALEAFAPDAESKGHLVAQRDVWNRYKAVLEKAPQASSVATIVNLSDEVLATGERATNSFARIAGRAGGSIVDVSGRQRMLSQRIAKLYAQGVAVGDIKPGAKDIEAASAQFVSAMKQLEASPQNNDYIRQMLVVAQSQWAFYERAVRSALTGSQSASLADDVAKSSENILLTMDSVTAAYAQVVG
jgi:hypothetical protein